MTEDPESLKCKTSEFYNSTKKQVQCDRLWYLGEGGGNDDADAVVLSFHSLLRQIDVIFRINTT